MNRRIAAVNALIITSILLYIFNSIQFESWAIFQLQLVSSQVFLMIGIISLVFFFLLKKYRKVLSGIIMTCFSLMMLLNIYLFSQYIHKELERNHFQAYEKLTTCQQMEDRFKQDIENDQVKYFDFGIGSMILFNEVLKESYGIETYAMGCIVEQKYECYNELVANYLKEEYGKAMTDIYSEVDDLAEIRYGIAVE